jgi:hypothetical protein
MVSRKTILPNITLVKGKEMQLLNKIQQELKAPKGQKNTFGGYMYRSCEDILEAVKPLLGNAVLTLDDEVICVGGRNYVKSTAWLMDGEDKFRASGYACEAESKKGMDSAQITGAASSYARKYALNGLFCIDDTKDADTQDNRQQKTKEPETTKPKADGSIKKKFTALPKMSDEEKAIMANVYMLNKMYKPKDLTPNDFKMQMSIDVYANLGKWPSDENEEDVTIHFISDFYKEKK